MVSIGGGGSLFLHRFTITHVTFLKKLICRVQQHQQLWKMMILFTKFYYVDLYKYIDDVSSKNKINHLDTLSQYDNCALDNTVLHVTKEQNRAPGSAAWNCTNSNSQVIWQHIRLYSFIGRAWELQCLPITFQPWILQAYLQLLCKIIETITVMIILFYTCTLKNAWFMHYTQVITSNYPWHIHHKQITTFEWVSTSFYSIVWHSTSTVSCSKSYSLVSQSNGVKLTGTLGLTNFSNGFTTPWRMTKSLKPGPSPTKHTLN